LELYKQKTAAKVVSVSFGMSIDQAASALLRRRYVMAPMPAKPKIIIAQVEGSGTALAKIPELPPQIVIA
jgi:hypothetical protein